MVPLNSSENDYRNLLYIYLRIITNIDCKLNQCIQDDNLSRKITKVSVILHYIDKIKRIRHMCINPLEEISKLDSNQKIEQFLVLKEILGIKSLSITNLADFQNMNNLLYFLENDIFNDFLQSQIVIRQHLMNQTILVDMILLKTQNYFSEKLSASGLSLTELSRIIFNLRKSLNSIDNHQFIAKRLDQINISMRNLIETSNINLLPITIKDYDKLDLLYIDNILNKAILEIEPLIMILEFFESSNLKFEFSHIILRYINLECYYLNKICVTISEGTNHWTFKWDDLEFCMLKIFKRCILLRHSKFISKIIDRVCFFYENHFKSNVHVIKSYCSKLDYLSIVLKALNLLERITLMFDNLLMTDLSTINNTDDISCRLKVLLQYLNEEIRERTEISDNKFDENSEFDGESIMGILSSMKEDQSINSSI